MDQSGRPDIQRFWPIVVPAAALILLGIGVAIWRSSELMVPKVPPDAPGRNVAPGGSQPTLSQHSTELPTSRGAAPLTGDANLSSEGRGAWMLTQILLPQIRKLKELDPEGKSRAGLEWILGRIRRSPTSFTDRMERAVAVRLIPYAVRGHPGLRDEATGLLSEFSQDVTLETYARIAAVAALGGFQLNYNVRPVLSGPTEALDVEVYGLNYNIEADGPDVASVRDLALADAKVRGVLRELVEGRSPLEVAEAAANAIALKPSVEDKPALFRALELDLDIVDKKRVLRALAEMADPEAATKVMQLHLTAEQEGDGPLSRACQATLIDLGIAPQAAIIECVKVLRGECQTYAWAQAAELLARMASRAGSPEARAALGAVLTGGRPENERRYAVRMIGEYRIAALAPLLDALRSGNASPPLRQAAEEALQALSK